MASKLENQIIEHLIQDDHILVLPSRPSDGDSLGSALALYCVLTKLGKKVTVISAEPVPKDLKFLPMIEHIDGEFKTEGNFMITVNANIKDVKHEIMPGKVNIILTPDGQGISNKNISFDLGLEEYQLIVTVDTGGVEQLGEFYEKHNTLFGKIPVINIDHHASNTHFGTINHVDIKAAATTEMLVPIIQGIEAESGKILMDGDIATLLLAGIITDTGSFQHSNTTPKSLAIAAQLLDKGARQQEIIKHVYKTKSLATLRLWGHVLSKIKFKPELHFVWSIISQEDLAGTGAEMEDAGSIIDELLNNAPGAEVVALMKEKKPGIVSCSLRSTTDAVDVSKIAEYFGGGGHRRAAGFRLKDTDFEEGIDQIVHYISALQSERYSVAKTAPQKPIPIEPVSEEPTATESPRPTASTAGRPASSGNGIKIRDTFHGESLGDGEHFYRFEE